MMAEQFDISTLAWVKSEIDETLKQARVALERYVDEPDNEAELELCISLVHQVFGTLQMVELSGAAMFAGEMEEFGSAIQKGQVEKREQAYELLMRAVLQLPDYLESLLEGHGDNPQSLVPLLNAMRQQRGENSLDDKDFFRPNLLIAPPPRSTIPPDGIDSAVVAKKLHRFYMSALVKVIKVTDVQESLKILATVIDKLLSVAETDNWRRLLWVSAGLVESLRDESISLTNQSKPLLGKLEQQIKVVAAKGETGLEEEAGSTLLLQMLYLLGRSPCTGKIAAGITKAFELERYMPQEGSALRGLNAEVKQTVSADILDELSSVKDSFDVFVRSDRSNIENLQPIAKSLERIAETLRMLQEDSLRQVLQQQVDIIGRLLTGELQFTDETLMGVAAAIIAVESTLRDWGNESPLVKADADEEQISDTDNTPQAAAEHLRVTRQVMKEARNDLVRVREAINAYLDNPEEKSILDNLPSLLHVIIGSLTLLSYKRVAQVLASCRAFIQKDLIQAKTIPSSDKLDALADAVMSVEYYLEAFVQSRVHPGSVLDVAESAVRNLGSSPGTDIDPLDTEETFSSEPAGSPNFADIEVGTPEFEEEIEEQSSSAGFGMPVSQETDIAAKSIQSDNPDDGFETLEDLASTEKQIDPIGSSLETSFSSEFEPVTTSAPVASTDVVGETPSPEVDETDDEIIEIFIEEAEEELNNLRSLFPQWSANPAAIDVLKDLRRSFHTLKGSGRLVGASELGEFAWAFEDILNRVLDGAITHNAAMFDVIGQAIDALPELIEQFKSGTQPQSDIALLQEMANEIAYQNKAHKSATIQENKPAVVEENIASAEVGNEIPELDPVLLEIYSKEAASHLDELEAFISQINSGGSRRVTEPVIRALHTLQGSSRMAGVTGVADVCVKLEKYVKTLQASNEVVDHDGIDALAECVSYVRAVLDFFNTSDGKDFPDSSGALDLANSVYEKVQHLEYIAHAQPESGLAQQWDSDEVSLSSLTLLNDSTDDADAYKVEDDSDAVSLSSLTLLNDSTDNADAYKVEDDSDAVSLSSLTLLNDSTDNADAYEIEADSDEVSLSSLTLLNDSTDNADAYEIEADSDEVSLSSPALLNDSTDDADIYDLDEADEEITFAPADDIYLEALEALDPPFASEELQIPDGTTEGKTQREDATPVNTDSLIESDIIITQDDYDPELLDIFLEEGADILDASEATLQAWVDNPSDHSLVEELQRQLHTLKGGARMAGISAIGDLSHSLESTVEKVVDGLLESTPAMMDLLQLSHDRLVTMLEQVRNHEPVTQGDDLILQVENLSHRTGFVPEEESFILANDADVAFEPVGDSDIVPESPASPAEFRSITMPEIEPDLSALEKAVSDVEVNLTRWMRDINDRELFENLRHSGIKLGRVSSEFGINEIVNLTDAVVSLLSAINDGYVPAAKKSCDLMLFAMGRIQLMMTQVKTLEPVDNSGSLISEIREVITIATAELGRGEKNVELAKEQAGSDSAVIEDENRRKAPRIQHELVRVRADLLDNLVNFAGEVSIYRSRVEQQIGSFRSSIEEMDHTVVRLREQVRQFDIETESQIESRKEEAEKKGYEEFDPLEFDRFTQMQQLSRSMVESLSDLVSIEDILLNLTRESETLLLQQSRVNTELQESLMHTRMVPLVEYAPRLRRIVRQTSSELAKRTNLSFKGADVEMDRNVVARMMAPLEHMLRNSIAHGVEGVQERLTLGKPEVGNIVISLSREGSEIVVRVSDDGAGINLNAVKKKAIERGLMKEGTKLSDKEIMGFILESGFSTAESLSQIAGRGVGMDVVNSEIKQLGGVLEIESTQGKGTELTIRLPLTLSVSRALLVNVGEDVYAIPLLGISGIERISASELEALLSSENPVFDWVGEEYDVLHLSSLLGVEPGSGNMDSANQALLLTKSGEQRIAFAIEGMIGSREIVVKTLGPQLSTLQGLAGATILADGSVALIIDMPSLIRRGMAGKSAEANEGEAAVVRSVEESVPPPLSNSVPTIMVVDDSITVRKVTERVLKRHNLKCVTAKDGVDALTVLEETIPDVMLLDIEMPRMDGFELATHIRKTERLKNIPIIMITSRTGDKHRQRALDIGINRYMGKPYTEVDLLENIETLITGHAR